MQGRKLLHGGDYNPEQWLDRPDILAQDIELMKKARVNTVTLGVFSWSVLEPEEGVFKLDWLADIIHNLYANGIRTILATPSAARPAWLAHKYPEVRRVRLTACGNCTTGVRITAIPRQFIMRRCASSTKSWHGDLAMIRRSSFGTSPMKWAGTATAHCVRRSSAAGCRHGTGRWRH